MNKRTNKILKYIFWGLFASPFIVIISLLLLVKAEVFGELPTFEELESPKANTASNLISDDGTLLGQYFVQNRSFIDYNELSPHLVSALVSTEDARFSSHSGVDFMGLARVAIKTIALSGKQGGGSTISQQLAKNLFPRNLSRDDGKIERIFKLVIIKLKEWITATRLEYNYTKEEIVVMYLNIVEYGSNSYGIKSAAQTFFDKLPSEVTIEEAATLVGVVNAPTRYSPVRNPNNSTRRRNTVLKRMMSNGKITSAMCDSLCAIPLTLKYKQTTHNDGVATYFRSMIQRYMTANEPKRNHFYSRWDYEQEKILWDTDPVFGWCNKNKKSDGTPYNIYRDGLRIYTTLNVKMQKYAEESLTEHMRDNIQPSFDAEVRKKGTIFSDISPEERTKIIWNSIKSSDRYSHLSAKDKKDSVAVLAEFNRPSKMRVFSYDYPGGRDTVLTAYDSILYNKSILRASFVAMNPTNGEVKAYVGGNDFRYFKYDMVKHGKRQVGSTIKPFIYTFAIDHLGLTPCTPVPNSPVTVEGWTPKESGNPKQDGEIRPLWWGLAKSRNNFSTWIIRQSNYKAVADLIHKLGIRSFIDPVPSMCLGPSNITLYEMVGAYSTFVNMGVHIRPSFITKIEDKHGNIISNFTAPSNDAISESSAYHILSILQKVTNAGGTGARLRWKYNFKNEMGGKTGTTNNGSDGWFIGITPKLVAGSWVGGENPSVHPEFNSEGSALALPIYARFLKKVHADKSLDITPKDKFRRPVGYTTLDCPDILKIEKAKIDDIDIIGDKDDKEDFFQ